MILMEEKVTDRDLLLRRAKPEDREAVVAMYDTFEPKGACMGLPPRKDPGRWLDDLSHFPNFLVVAGAQVVAHAALCPEGDMGEVAVFVHQDCRGKGLGKLLLAELIAEGRRLGLRRIWGMTEWDNVPMLRLARSLGFLSAADPREFYLNLK